MALSIDSPDILILGGGIIGLACASELDRRGLRVEILERGRCGQEASQAAAGMLVPLAEVTEDSPMLDACRAARDLWHDWAAELGHEGHRDLDYDRSGALVLDAGAGVDIDSLLERATALGEDARLVERAEIRRLVPDAAPEIERAVLLGDQHRVDNGHVCRALLDILRDGGVAVREQHGVKRLVADGDGVRVEGKGFARRAARVLLTAGAWSDTIEGLPALPVRPVRGQMLELDEIDWPWTGSVWARHFYAVRRARGRLLIGATVEEAGFYIRTTPDGQAELLDFCRGVFPNLGTKPIVSTWAGLRPGTPDDLPILGQLDEMPVFVATGHYRNGILLAPWTARFMADLLTGKGREEPAFSPRRFTVVSPP